MSTPSLPPEFDHDVVESEGGILDAETHQLDTNQCMNKTSVWMMIIAIGLSMVLAGYGMYSEKKQNAKLNEYGEWSERLSLIEASLTEVKNKVRRIENQNSTLTKSIASVKKESEINNGIEDDINKAFRGELSRLKVELEALGRGIESVKGMKAASKNKKNIKKKKFVQSKHEPMTLISIRSIGNEKLVAIQNREGRISPLLIKGESWRGWTFKGIDSKQAAFDVSGRSKVLVL